jgi:glycosyltransferase involved in cell wall biosynthesis
MPYFVTFDALRDSAKSAAGQAVVDRYSDDVVNLLFVGRLVPNKRQDDLIRAFNAYHHLVNSRSRLLLIGSEANAPGYRLELEGMAAALDLEDHVHFLGTVGLREGLGGFYRAATLFLCLSEHEGFCIPLVEAMTFEVPVVAYRSTGVPYAMDGAGVLVNAKHFGLLAELIGVLVEDANCRGQVLSGQRCRLNQLAPDRVAKILSSHIQHIIELDRNTSS